MKTSNEPLVVPGPPGGVPGACRARRRVPTSSTSERARPSRAAPCRSGATRTYLDGRGLPHRRAPPLPLGRRGSRATATASRRAGTGRTPRARSIDGSRIVLRARRAARRRRSAASSSRETDTGSDAATARRDPRDPDGSRRQPRRGGARRPGRVRRRAAPGALSSKSGLKEEGVDFDNRRTRRTVPARDRGRSGSVPRDRRRSTTRRARPTRSSSSATSRRSGSRASRP